MPNADKLYIIAKAAGAALVLGTYAYCKQAGIPVPAELQELVNLVLGLYFAATAATAVAKARRS